MAQHSHFPYNGQGRSALHRRARRSALRPSQPRRSGEQRGTLLREAGVSAVELYKEGHCGEELVALGFSVKDLKQVGFQPYHCRQLGLTMNQCLAGGYVFQEFAWLVLSTGSTTSFIA